MRAVVYYGGSAQCGAENGTTANFDLLYPLLDLVTSLDPHFKVAYRFGAMFLTEPYPGGPGGRISPLRCCSAASSSDAGALGVHTRTSASSITGGCATTRRRPSGSSGQRTARRAGVARRRWRPRRWPRAATATRRGCSGRSCCRTPTSNGSQPTPSIALQQLDAMDTIDELNRRCAALRRARAAARRIVATSLAAAEGCARHPDRSDRHAFRLRSRNRPHRRRREVAAVAAAAEPCDTASAAMPTRDRPAVCSPPPALFGACIGSFLNVVIYRLPLGQSLVTPPSRCRKCGYSLRWFDNIPVLSWVLLRGRCRKCGVGDVVAIPARRADHGARCSCWSSG